VIFNLVAQVIVDIPVYITSVHHAAGAGVWSIARVNTETGEIAGVFETIQPSDTDLGAKEPKEVKVTGIWYGSLEKN